jgi:glyoxylase-like metal-dependent hydrolase (beta-lactamase superfamily II)
LREAMSGQRDDRDEYELPDAWILGETDIELGHRTLRAVPTPGHTRGHLVFADADRSLLFSGDHILPTITPSIGLEPVRSDDCLSDFLRSLQLIAAMPDMQLLPAHGMPDRRSQARAAELLDHHERRLKSTLESMTAYGNTPYDVASRLAWTRAERGLHELDAFNQYLAAGETAAHLDLLLRRGQVIRTEDAGVRSYRKAPTQQTPVVGDG